MRRKGGNGHYLNDKFRMKVECPVCSRMGILEQRGNSSRVLHYKGFFNGKRVYEKHSIKLER